MAHEVYLGQIVIAQELADVGGHSEVGVRFGMRSGTVVSQILQMGEKKADLSPCSANVRNERWDGRVRRQAIEDLERTPW